MSGQIFISYRRQESGWSARSLRDRLCRDFDPDQIFMDLDSIALGEDFVEAIETTVARCDVLIAVIGNNWLTSTDERGGRRLDNPQDFVRMEIGTALKRRIRVIPVLVDGALMPRSTDLPDDLKLLVRRNALQITNTSFGGDCQRLVAAIKLVLEKAATSTPPSAPMPTSALPAFTGTVSPDPAAFFNDRGFEWLQSGESLPAFGAGSRDPAAFFYDRGFNFQKRGEYVNAISDYSTAIRMNPGYARAYYNRGLAYRMFGKQSKAQADFDKAKQLGYTGPE
jgi:hypothetical protein